MDYKLHKAYTMADTIASAKKRRGRVRAHLTRMEKDSGKLEEKEELTPLNGKKIRRLKELAKEHDREFEERHVEVLNFIEAEDTAALESEKAVLMNTWIVSLNSSNS